MGKGAGDLCLYRKSLRAGEEMQGKERHPSDPRPDLVTDRRHWEEVLYNSWYIDKEIYYLLHGIRCGGAGAILTQNGFKLMPGEWSESEWNDDIKNRLNPFRDKLVNIFKLTRFGKISEETLPDGVFEAMSEEGSK